MFVKVKSFMSFGYLRKLWLLVAEIDDVNPLS